MLADDNGILTDDNSVAFHVNASVKTSAKLNRHVYDCQKGDFQGLRRAVHNFVFTNIVESSVDVNIVWSRWKEKLLDKVHNYISSKKVKRKDALPLMQGKYYTTYGRKKRYV